MIDPNETGGYESRLVAAMRAALADAERIAGEVRACMGVHGTLAASVADTALRESYELRQRAEKAEARADHEHNEMVTQAKLAADWCCDATRAFRERDELKAEVARLREALADQLDEHKHTWLVARAGVEGAGVSANLFEAESSTQRARALLRGAPPPAEQVNGPETCGDTVFHAMLDEGVACQGCGYSRSPRVPAPPPSPAGPQPGNIEKLGALLDAGGFMVTVDPDGVAASFAPKPAAASSGRDTGPISGVWRCAECGEEANANPIVSEWRWSGAHWEHHHGVHVGHVHARYFGPASARRWAVRFDSPPAQQPWLMCAGLGGEWQMWSTGEKETADFKAKRMGGTVVEVDENGKEVGDG